VFALSVFFLRRVDPRPRGVVAAAAEAAAAGTAA